jgi:hypothetical protein
VYDDVLNGMNGDSMAVAHYSARNYGGSLAIEPCDRDACTVNGTGFADCGARACPMCGTGGATLTLEDDLLEQTRHATCRHCGHTWRI